jgi:MraZ protein
VPASHRGAIGIDKRAVLLGMGDKFELWSEHAHREQVGRVLDDDALGDALLDLRL